MPPPLDDASTHPPRQLEQVRNAIRARHMSIRTEEAYANWVRRYIVFHGKKYPSMNAGTEWIWQWVFPSKKLSIDPRSGIQRRHHVSEKALQRAVRQATRIARIDKKVTCHTFRHSFATHLLEDVEAYIAAIAHCARHFGRSPDRLSVEQIRGYLVMLRDEQQCSWSRIRTTGSVTRSVRSTV